MKKNLLLLYCFSFFINNNGTTQKNGKELSYHTTLKDIKVLPSRSNKIMVTLYFEKPYPASIYAPKSFEEHQEKNRMRFFIPKCTVSEETQNKIQQLLRHKQPFSIQEKNDGIEFVFYSTNIHQHRGSKTVTFFIG